MEFRGRNTQTSTPQAAARPAGNFAGGQLSKLRGGSFGKLFSIGSVLLLFALAGLLIALTFFMVFGNKGQLGSVNKGKYQAVFLNNGQVYFGNIKAISGSSYDLQNIYYLQTNGSASTEQNTQPSNVSLVKLGCELHAPYDQMVINADQVLFWENLQDSSQVVKAISEYRKQNNNSTNCSQQSQSSTQQAPSTNTQNASPTTNGTTPTPTTNTNKKP